MQNEETVQFTNSSQTTSLRIKRKKHLVGCLSKVLVNLDGNELAVLSNGEEILLPIKPGSIIELDLQAPAWHNYYKLEITGQPEIEFGFNWFGSGEVFKHNNLRIKGLSGCRILSESTELTDRQKRDNKASYWFIGILLAAYVVLLLMKYCLGISL